MAWFHTVDREGFQPGRRGLPFSPGQKRPALGQAGLLIAGWDAPSPASQTSEGCFETLHVNFYSML